MQQEQGERKTGVKKRGFYAKSLAVLQNESGKLKRGKKSIKKENSVVCKQARQRKKKYISVIEEHNNQLIGQNQKLKEEIQNMKIFFSSENEKLRQEITVLKQHLQHLKINGGGEVDQRTKMLATQFRELVTSIKKNDRDNISRSLCVLRVVFMVMQGRFGVAGQERKKWIEENILRTIQLSMPLHFRVLIDNVQDRSYFLYEAYKFFELLGGTQEMKNSRHELSENQKAILKEMKPRIKTAKQNFNSIFKKFHEVQTQLKNYSIKAQEIIDSIQQNLDCVFVGNLLIDLDSRRCTNEDIKQIYPINYFKQLIHEQYRQEYEPIIQEQMFHSIESDDEVDDAYAFNAVFGF